MNVEDIGGSLTLLLHPLILNLARKCEIFFIQYNIENSKFLTRMLLEPAGLFGFHALENIFKPSWEQKKMYHAEKREAYLSDECRIGSHDAENAFE